MHHQDVEGYETLSALIMSGDKEALTTKLRALIDPDTWIMPRLTPGQAIEMRRRQFALLSRGEFCELLEISPSRYSEYLNSRRPVPIKVLRRCYAMGVRIEPLLGLEKPRDPFFGL